MHLSDFTYSLPEHLIAQTPLEKRDHSKLLLLNKNTWEIQEKIFHHIIDFLTANDVLVLNKTQVIPARLYGELDIFPNGKKEIKKVEILLHKEIWANTWECLGYPGKNLKIGRVIRFYDAQKNLLLTGKILKVSEMGRFIEFSASGYELLKILHTLWEIPLPHYIHKKLENTSRYQTVYSQTPGSAAAPTAGLHFTEELLKKIEQKWVKIEKVLLHVWVGTFKPVETPDIKNHQMHSEYIEIEPEVAQRLNTYKKEGKRIIAVGTTSVRTLESFTNEKWILESGNKETSIFIYPGYEWRFIDSLITNFHLPESTLLMLISALASKDFVMNAYKYAIKNEFRFFSFGDAMFIH